MKKSLMLISFAFIFLLSISIVSAGFFDWITGDVGNRQTTAKNTPTAIKSADSGTAFSRTSSSDLGTSSVRKSSTSSRSSIRRSGLVTIARADGNGECYIFPENSRLFGLVKR